MPFLAIWCYSSNLTIFNFENKKRCLNVDFSEAHTLRSFFELKLASLYKFTTLPFINQVEIILNDLPPEISKRFIINEKMTGNKTVILDFCDTIQDLTEHFNENKPSNEAHQESSQPSNRMEMEIFNFMQMKRERSRIQYVDVDADVDVLEVVVIAS